ncbi:hypothetical protein P9X10_00635 [Bacillus cereus]|nr:hypothetical protein [Bacillus cereus]
MQDKQVKTYKVRLNRTESIEGIKPKEFTVNIQAENEEELQLHLSKLSRRGLKHLSYEERIMSNPDIKLVDMEEGENYKIISYVNSDYDTLTLKREGKWVQIKLVEVETDTIREYKLKVEDTLKELQMLGLCKYMMMEDLNLKELGFIVNLIDLNLADFKDKIDSFENIIVTP